QLSIAFMTDPDVLARLDTWRRDGWLRMLASSPHTLARIESGGYRLETRPRVAAAGTSRLDCFGGEGWLAAGDAAVSYDPLSSHGIGTAIATGAQAARAVLAHVAGEAQALSRY